jgi:hypothetical protein
MIHDHVHSAGDSDPTSTATTPAATIEPVLALTGMALATDLAAALALAARRPRTAALTLGLGAVATALAGAGTRAHVTPMARPRDEEGDPLTPLAPSEPEIVVHVEDRRPAAATADDAPPVQRLP